MVTHGYVSSKFETGLHGMWVVGHATPYATAAATKLLLFHGSLKAMRCRCGLACLQYSDPFNKTTYTAC